MKILVSAIACGHGLGSEPGVGWNTAMSLSEHNQVTVLTSSRFRDRNDAFLANSTIPFSIEYFDIGGTDKSITSKQALRWHKSALERAQSIVRSKSIEAAIHTTFNQYRLPFVASRLGIPYVIGPVGGAETVPFGLMPRLPLKILLKETFRYTPLDTIPHLLWRDFPDQSHGHLLCSCPSTMARLQPFWKEGNISVLPAISIDDTEIITELNQVPREPYIVYAGRILPEKGISLLFEALGRCNISGTQIKCKIIGAKGADEISQVRQLAEKHHLPHGSIEAVPFIERSKLKEILTSASAFVYPAFRDSGSMAVLEALAVGAWPICLDISSQHWLPPGLGCKIKPSSFPRVADLLATAIIDSISKNVRNPTWNEQRIDFLLSKMTWKAKARDLNRLLTLASHGN